MKKSTFGIVLALALMALAGCSDKKRDAIGHTEVVLETSMGKITVRLYDDTPLHRDNFVRMARMGAYDGIVWNRIVEGSTIQSGDPLLRADGGKPAVDPVLADKTIKAEIHYPRHFHKPGALGMARQPDDINPGRESSATQFYIVTGKVYTTGKLAELHQFMLDTDTLHNIPSIPAPLKEVYTTRGGAPHLDGAYTVFGEVVDGMRVVEAIGKVPCDEHERPLKQVVLERVTVKD